MPEDNSWSWVEKALKKIPIPYPFVSLILFISCFLVYKNLSGLVDGFPDYQNWDMDTRMNIIITSFLIAYGLAGVRYFIDNMRAVFSEIEPAQGCENKIDDLNDRLEKKFTKSKIFYLIYSLFLIPYIPIDLESGMVYSYFRVEKTNWAIYLDIFNWTVTLLIIYLMTKILWIVLNTLWALKELESDPQRPIIKIDLFDADKVGGLKPIRDLNLKLIVYQFIALSFAGYLSVMPEKNNYQELTIYGILFFITVVYLFATGWHTIHKLLEGERERKINSINELYRQQNQRAQDIVTSKGYLGIEDKLEGILNSINFLHDERERVKEASKHVYNLKSIFIFISSSLIPLIPNITAFINPVTSPEGSELSEQIIPTMICFNQTALPIIKEYLLTYI